MRNRILVIGFCLFVWAAFLLVMWQVAHGDGSSSPPECPPGLVCEWPTATAPAVTSEPYPPPYPAPYPAPDYLPLVAGESYP